MFHLLGVLLNGRVSRRGGADFSLFRWIKSPILKAAIDFATEMLFVP